MPAKNQLDKVRNGPPLDERLIALTGVVANRLKGMSSQQRLWTILSGGVALLALTGVLWYASRPDWRVLYAGLDPQDSREMATQLTAAGIAFDVSADGGTLRVTSDTLDKARLQTAAKGGPKSGRMGFELFDKPNWVGSEFDEKVNYQRALEGELEHTIATLGSVQSARVHLVLPHDSLFSDQQRQAKASVVLKLKHRSMTSDESDSVRNLVANAVDDLRPDSVVLVSADGQLPLSAKGPDAESQLREQALTEKLIETLEPVVGAGNVRASVNVEYDRSQSDETDETYDPNGSVPLSMQRSEQSSGATPIAAGVPGTASNAPNVQPPLFPQQSSSPQSVKQESGTYGVSKKVRHSVDSAAKVGRITAAIVVNNRLLPPAGKGKQSEWQARTPEEMKQIAALAQAAVGFDAERGDAVQVENLAFEDNAGLTSLTMPQQLLKLAGQAPGLLRTATILLAVLAVLVLVVRPVTKKMTAALLLPAPAVKAPASQQALAVREPVELPMVAVEIEHQRAQQLFEEVAGRLKNQPAQGSRLLQSWIHSE
jgi:flagellar M-ring protein FliF